jgi:hypothetical protein
MFYIRGGFSIHSGQNALQYMVMWPFKRKKANRKPAGKGPPCSFCGSTQTIVVASAGEGQPGVKIWRGQRYLTCRCLTCGRDFYADEPPEGLLSEVLEHDSIIDDEEELRAAEEDLKKRTEDDRDRRCR